MSPEGRFLARNKVNTYMGVDHPVYRVVVLTGYTL